MKMIFDNATFRVCWSLVAAATLMATSSCGKPAETEQTKTDQAAATPADADQAETTGATAPAAESTQPAPTHEDMEKLAEEATTGSGITRYTAIDDLGERAGESDMIVPDLIQNLDDKDPQVVWRSVRTLGDYGEEAVAAAPKLRELFTKDDPILQYHVAVTLGKIGDRTEETVDMLVAAVGSADGRVSRAAIEAMKILRPGPQKTVPALKKALASGNSAVAAHALDAIVEVGPEAVPLINEMLKDPATVYMAATAAAEIGPGAAGTVPELEEVLKDTKHSQLQIQLLLALGRIGPAAKSAAPQMIDLLENSPDSTVPVAAAFALGSVGAAEADAPLHAAADAKDKPFLSMVAAWSLARLHPDDAALKQQAIDRLNAGMKSKDPAIQAAAERGLKMLELPAGSAAK
jgi:HEAT repeat protein